MISDGARPETVTDSYCVQEHHLQAIIAAAQDSKAGGKIAQLFIPTPDAVASKIKYDELYPRRFAQPATYIRFSSTVEDSIGCPYCMTAEDEAWLSNTNQHKRREDQCSPDEFEEVMNFLEVKSQEKQPWAALDNSPVLTIDEMDALLDETLREEARPFLRTVYPHWKAERLERGHRPLVAKLKTPKLETGQDADDSDPFVCFRRREVRQVRKTRGRDAQIAEKLKRLRKELEDARQLLSLVREREQGRKEDLAVSRKIFEQRAELRQSMCLLNIQDEEDDLLVTAKTPKKRPVEVPTTQRLQAGSQLKLITHQDSVAPPETDVVKLRELFAQRDQKVQTQINSQIDKHEQWNQKFIDRTVDSLLGINTNIFEKTGQISVEWASIKIDGTKQLPTPPESIGNDYETEEERPAKRVRIAHPREQKSFRGAPRFRSRIGRGGRLLLDRHNMRCATRAQISHVIVDRFKYDREDGDDEMLGLVDLYINTAYFRQEPPPRPREPSQSTNSRPPMQVLPSPASSRDIAMTNGDATAGITIKS